MTDVDRSLIISDRVLPLSIDETSKTLRVLRPGLPEFGEDAFDSRDAYEDVLRGYKHDRRKVCDGKTELWALVLVPPGTEVRPMYVEIDDWARPIEVSSEEGLVGVKAVERVLQAGTGELRREIEHIPALVEHFRTESLELRLATFNMLRERLSAASDGTQPGVFDDSRFDRIFWLLPWERVNQYLLATLLIRRGIDAVRHILDRAISRAEGTEALALKRSLEWVVEREAEPSQVTLPRLRHYFRHLSPGLAPALRSLVEMILAAPGATNDPSAAVRSIARFVFRLDGVSVRKLPGSTHALIVPFLQDLVSLLPEAHLTYISPQLARARGRALVTIPLIAMKIRESSSRLDLQALLYNLEDALAAGDSARFFEQAPQYLGDVVRHLDQAYRMLIEAPIHGDPMNLERDPSLKKSWEKPDALLNAAEVCRFQAQLEFYWRRDGGQAKRALNLAQPFYREAETATKQLTEARRFLPKLYKRRARSLMLYIDILGSEGNEAEAIDALTKAQYYIDQIPAVDQGQAVRASFLRVLAQLAILRHFPQKTEIASAVERELNLLAAREPTAASARDLLLSYLVEIKGDLEAACALADSAGTTADGNQGAESPNERPDSLQYKAARAVAAIAIEDPCFASLAITRYLRLLVDQPRNMRATIELLELLEGIPYEEMQLIVSLIESSLEPITAEACPLTHAAVRALFTDVAAPRICSPAEGLVVLLRGPADQYGMAAEILERVGSGQIHDPLGVRNFRALLEVLSKCCFERGRRTDLETAERILTLALRMIDASVKLEPNADALSRYLLIWQTRLLDIALSQHDLQKAELIASNLQQRFPNDPIVGLKSAILRIEQGRFEEADGILRKEMDVEADGEEEDDPHPAILDRLAFVALRRGQFSEAQTLYRRVLERNEFDASARFGLGRVYFEENTTQWRLAFEEWLHALRIRAKGDEDRDHELAWLTAKSIASLCASAVARGLWQSRGHCICDRVEQALREEDSSVARMLVDALSVVGVTDLHVVSTAVSAVASREEPLLLRRVAQYLMARSIYGVLGISASSFDVRELDRYVSWCWGRGVHADYLAGAKGAYGRALLRMRHRGVDVERSLQRDWLTSFESSLEPRLRDLYEHIRGTADSQTYYRDADSLISTIDSEQADWSTFVMGLVRGVAGTAWRAGERLEDTLAKVVPAKRICSLADLVNATDGTAAVGGLVDSDALIVAERRYFGSRWHVAGSRIERSILGSIPEGRLAFVFGKFGVFFTSEPGHNGSRAAARCFVEVMPSNLTRSSIPEPGGLGVSVQSIIS